MSHLMNKDNYKKYDNSQKNTNYIRHKKRIISIVLHPLLEPQVQMYTTHDHELQKL